jgi:hypothetical protein
MSCNAVQCNAMQCNAMQCNAMQCNAMQCNAMQCNAMQCNAMQCNAMEWNGMFQAMLTSKMISHIKLHLGVQCVVSCMAQEQCCLHDLCAPLLLAAGPNNRFKRAHMCLRQGFRSSKAYAFGSRNGRGNEHNIHRLTFKGGHTYLQGQQHSICQVQQTIVMQHRQREHLVHSCP